MGEFLKCEHISFDVEKSHYDLATLYAKSKLEEAIRNGTFDGSKAPVEVEQMEYLAEEFYSALGYFSNTTNDYIKALVDRA